MQWFTADLHIHSVLSPCGGLEMSPRELIAQVKRKELIGWLLTDHNSLANCPAYASVAEREGVFFTWGVEVQLQKKYISWFILILQRKEKSLGNCFMTHYIPRE
jgi:predicted metal-dependent phosphoesterase TrpH